MQFNDRRHLQLPKSIQGLQEPAGCGCQPSSEARQELGIVEPVEAVK
jgi:hypothetical protein